MFPIVDRKRQAPEMSDKDSGSEEDDHGLWTTERLTKRFNNADFGFSHKPDSNPALAANPFQKYPFITSLSRKRLIDSNSKDEEHLPQPAPKKMPLIAAALNKNERSSLKFQKPFEQPLAVSRVLYAEAIKAAVNREFDKYSKLARSATKLVVDHSFDEHYVSVEQSKSLCLNAVKKVEEIVRDQYEAELSKRLTLQYESFTKYTNDNLFDRFKSTDEPSYIS